MMELPNNILETLKNASCEVFSVGGIVRDELIGLPSKDLDIVVLGASLDKLESLLKPFGKVDLVGKSFGVIKFTPEGWEGEAIDVAIPRKDVKTGSGHKDFDVVLDDVSLEDDRNRRDFTINALMKNLFTNEIVDFDNGIGMKDINEKIIRMISKEAFIEDPLRMLRMVQFSSRFEFHIEEKTFFHACENIKLIHTVSKDRFLEEFIKLFTKSARPSIGIKLMFKIGMIGELFPLLNFSLIDLDKMDKLEKSDFCLFMFILLEQLKLDQIRNILTEFRFNNEFIQTIVELKMFSFITDISRNEIVRFNIDKRSKDDIFVLVDKWLILKGINISIVDMLSQMRTEGIPTCMHELPINGNDLKDQGFQAQEIGKELRRLLLDTL